MMDAVRDALNALLAGRTPTAEGAQAAIGAIMDGQSQDALTGALLAAWNIRGFTGDDLAGGVRAMRARAIPLDLRAGDVLDTCGTGGDGANTLNISTGAAIIAAAAGVPIAKHGNRAISGSVGAADLLEALGVKIDCDAAGLARCLREANFCFVFAPAYHPAFGRIAAMRRALGIRTIFNVLGALGNPASPRFHLMGVATESLIEPCVSALRTLGARRAMVVRGRDGIDEISTCASTSVAELRADGQALRYELSPADFGIEPASRSALAVRDLGDAARRFRDALAGRDSAAENVLALNAGAAIYLYGKEATIAGGIACARKAIASGAALDALERVRRASNLT
jgi:anthranilate phosphoribosyltransferase